MKYWIVLLCLVLAGQGTAMAKSLNCDTVTSSCKLLCTRYNEAGQKFDALWQLPQVQQDQGSHMTPQEDLMLACHSYQAIHANVAFLTCEKNMHLQPHVRQQFAQLATEQQQLLYSQSDPLFIKIRQSPSNMCTKAWDSPVPARR